MPIVKAILLIVLISIIDKFIFFSIVIVNEATEHANYSTGHLDNFAFNVTS